MGLIRFLLAACVVFGHLGGTNYLGDPRLAVQFFFLISGFLISFILNKDPAYSKTGTFYLNRALRLYPVYYVVAAATLLLWLATGKLQAADAVLNGGSKLVLAASNLLIVGQDMVMFLKQTSDGVAFTRNFRWEELQLWEYLLIPPAWSLSLEIVFYAIAPFVVRRLSRIVVVAGTSLLLTTLGWHAGLVDDPWTYRFFPFELSVFLLGSLSERLLLPAARRFPALAVAAPAVAALLFIGFPSSGMAEPYRSIVALGGFAMLLPLLFLFQGGRKWDIAIGNLSYPIYIGHMLALALAAPVADALGMYHRGRIAIDLVFAMLVALLLEHLVNRPVERLRRRVRHHRAPVDRLETEPATQLMSYNATNHDVMKVAS